MFMLYWCFGFLVGIVGGIVYNVAWLLIKIHLSTSRIYAWYFQWCSQETFLLHFNSFLPDSGTDGSAKFQLDSQSGQLKTVSAIDREEPRVNYVVTVKAFDAGSPSLSVTGNHRHNAPGFIQYC